MKRIINLLAKMATMAAFVFVVANVNSTCTYIWHQPKPPEAANRLKF